MTEVIIYDDGGTLKVFVPSGEGLESYRITSLAERVVPSGIPFLIVDREEVPEDRTFRDAWEADFSEPHGYGLGYENWMARQLMEEAA